MSYYWSSVTKRRANSKCVDHLRFDRGIMFSFVFRLQGAMNRHLADAIVASTF
jgi:hypothetical protein